MLFFNLQTESNRIVSFYVLLLVVWSYMIMLRHLSGCPTYFNNEYWTICILSRYVLDLLLKGWYGLIHWNLHIVHEAWTCDMEEVVRYVFNTPVVQQVPIRECRTMEGQCLFLQVVLYAHAHTWGIPCCEQTNITSTLRPGSILSCISMQDAIRWIEVLR